MKRLNYSKRFSENYAFIPFVVETLGPCSRSVERNTSLSPLLLTRELRHDLYGYNRAFVFVRIYYEVQFMRNFNVFPLPILICIFCHL